MGKFAAAAIAVLAQVLVLPGYAGAQQSAPAPVITESARTLYNRGAAYAGKGDYDRAIADYEAALRINPGDAAVRICLENVRRQARGQ